ncbi:hypothetical protein NS277_16485 [Novosphingobium barchaimii]|nr:hypothetical protein NS277_16485 [Novosphingobium barchaimii]
MNNSAIMAKMGRLPVFLIRWNQNGGFLPLWHATRDKTKLRRLPRMTAIELCIKRFFALPSIE